MTTVTAAATLAVQSPFNTSPAASGSFIPVVWSSKLNVKFYAATTFGDVSNTNWEGEIKSMGDKVIINNIPSITINTYTIGQALSYQVPTPSVVELPIDQALYFGVNVSDVIEFQAKPALMDMFTSDASNQLKISVDRDCFKNTFLSAATGNYGATAGVTSAAYDLGVSTAPITLTALNILSKFTALASVLDEQNVPETDRFLVITPFERQLLMQSNLAQAQFMGDSTSILRNGKIGRIDRFDVYVSNLLPTAAISVDYFGVTESNALKRHAVIAGHKSAMTFASQINKVENIPNPTDFGTLVRGLMVYGRKTVKGEALAYMQVTG